MNTQSWSLERAREAVAKLRLTGDNAEVAQRWLAAWSEQSPPLWGRFDLAPFARHMPAIAVFEVTPGERILCLLAGSLYKLALGFEITGRDLIALTPERMREQRWDNIKTILSGAVSLATRPIFRVNAKPLESEELALPFADVGDKGVGHYMLHTSWRPDYQEGASNAAPRAHAGLGDYQRIVPFAGPKAA